MTEEPNVGQPRDTHNYGPPLTDVEFAEVLLDRYWEIDIVGDMTAHRAWKLLATIVDQRHRLAASEQAREAAISDLDDFRRATDESDQELYERFEEKLSAYFKRAGGDGYLGDGDESSDPVDWMTDAAIHVCVHFENAKDDAESRAIAAESRAIQMREALASVEWGPQPVDVGSDCSWCLREKRDGHAPDCEVAAALSSSSSDGVMRVLKAAIEVDGEHPKHYPPPTNDLGRALHRLREAVDALGLREGVTKK